MCGRHIHNDDCIFDYILNKIPKDKKTKRKNFLVGYFHGYKKFHF